MLKGYLELIHFWIRCLRYRYRTEALQIKTLMSLDLGGATAIDIGANKGIYCFWMLKAVGASGRVIAMEPQPEMRAYIERRKCQLRWSQLTLFDVALSDMAGSAVLSRQRIGDGSASLETSRRRDDSQTITVPLATLDQFAEFENLRFIKCDVEGHEYRVFRGAEKTLRRFRPLVQFECIPGESSELFEFFHDLNYSGVMFLGGRYLHPSNPANIPHYKFGHGGHRDFLFFPKEAIGTVIPERLFDLFPAQSKVFPRHSG